MAKKKRGRRKQGLVSWATSIIALGIGLSGVFNAFKAGGINGIASRASFGMLGGGKFRLSEGLRIYMPMVGGIIFKKIAAELVKSAKVQSLVPRIG